MFNTTYELSLNKSYVRHWGVLEAVRELIQNALDSPSPFVFEFDREDDNTWTLILNSAYATLSPQSLLLGATSKADDADSIGSFGEGYKIALLVLTREGRPTQIVNDKKLWTPSFRYSKRFGDDLLIIEETDNGRPLRPGLTFLVSGLTAEEVEGIRDSCLQMQESVGEIKTTSRGDILMQKPGALYVGGLFICKTDLKYGYNIKPQHIKLERDRKTVDSWDLRSITRDMWFETEQFDDVAKMIEAEVPDIEYARWHSPQMVKEACYRLFRSKHPTAIVADSQADLQRLVKQGMTEVVVLHTGYAGLVRESPSYRNEPRPYVPTPQDMMREWYDDAKYHMHVKCRPGFEELLAKAARWRT